MKWLVLVVTLLTGCSAHTQLSVGAGSPQGGVQVQAAGGGGLAAVLGLSILAAGVYGIERERSMLPASQPAPEMAPDRKVSEQDCTKPLDLSLGNIRCK